MCVLFVSQRLDPLTSPDTWVYVYETLIYIAPPLSDTTPKKRLQLTLRLVRLIIVDIVDV